MSNKRECMSFANKRKILKQFGDSVRSWYDGEYVEAKTCTDCGYVCFDPPNEEKLSEYYSNEYGTVSKDWYSLKEDYREEKTISRSNDVIQLLDEYIGIESPVTLEIGCAFGGTVGKLRSRGISAFGIDLNSNAIARGIAHGNKYISTQMPSDFLQEHSEKTNLIYAYHALEHIPDPVSFLRSLKFCLADRAILAFRVPNGAYLKAKTKGFETWDWFHFPSHLHYFTPMSVQCLARNAGYELISIESSACGESADEMKKWLGMSSKVSIADNLVISLLEKALVLKELQFVLCIADSEIAIDFKDSISVANYVCVKSVIDNY